MTHTETSLRDALFALGFEVGADDVAALCGAAAAAGFIAFTDIEHQTQEAAWAAHHEFARGFSQMLQHHFENPSLAWSMVLNLVGFAIPAPDIDDGLLQAAPYLAVRLGAACCTLMAIDASGTGTPEETTAAAQAMSIVTEVASRLSALANPDHVEASVA